MKRPTHFPPATPRALATMLLLGGAAMFIIGWADLVLFYLPMNFGDPDWEFGTVSRTVDALPLCALGIVLLVTGVRGRGSRRLTARLLATLLVILAAVLAVLLVMFANDVPVALAGLSAQADRVGATAEQLALTRSGMKQASIKALLFGPLYIALFVTLAVMTWRNSGTPSE